MTDVPIRDAATIIVARKTGDTAQILMGQRGAKAAFMPNKFVFPGGALDDGDLDIALQADLPEACRTRLAQDADGTRAKGLAAAAIRELWEETGLILGQKGDWSDAPPDWQTYAARGFRPSAEAMNFVFRAITPPGRPRRFDARFFLIDADHIQGDLDDFSAASDELSHLQWIPIKEARSFDLPFITEVVLAEVAGLIASGQPPASVPFFNNNDEASLFLRLHGTAQTGD